MTKYPPHPHAQPQNVYAQTVCVCHPFHLSWPTCQVDTKAKPKKKPAAASSAPRSVAAAVAGWGPKASAAQEPVAPLVPIAPVPIVPLAPRAPVPVVPAMKKVRKTVTWANDKTPYPLVPQASGYDAGAEASEGGSTMDDARLVGAEKLVERMGWPPACGRYVGPLCFCVSAWGGVKRDRSIDGVFSST